MLSPIHFGRLITSPHLKTRYAEQVNQAFNTQVTEEASIYNATTINELQKDHTQFMLANRGKIKSKAKQAYFFSPRLPSKNDTPEVQPSSTNDFGDEQLTIESREAGLFNITHYHLERKTKAN